MIDFRFKKKFGQNFITDKNLLAAIAGDANIDSGDQVLEIGAGMGTLTEAIAQRAEKVVSYEIDTELKEYLEDKNLKNVSFIFADALKTKLSEIESGFKGNYKIVANLPYYITTPLIFKFLEESERVDSITIMIQKEVAERIVATPKDDSYGILSVILKFYGAPKITRIVKRNMFKPAPNVESAVLHLEINKNLPLDKKEFSNFVRAAFAMKRKTLVNNLSSYLSMDKAAVSEKLTSAGFNPSARAEDLNTDEFIRLYKGFDV